MSHSLVRYLEENRQRRENDARRFRELDEETCQLCLAHGEDKRSLRIACVYAIHEVVPEAMDLGSVPEENALRGGYFLRICKSCRGRLLAHLGQWRNECLALRDLPKDHDGNLGPPSEDHNVPVRINGAIHYLTLEEWHARYRDRDP
jgi:hypothetical protein